MEYSILRNSPQIYDFICYLSTLYIIKAPQKELFLLRCIYILRIFNQELPHTKVGIFGKHLYALVLFYLRIDLAHEP